MLLLVVGALAASLVTAADPVADRVLSVPGWSDPFRSARYSGYVAGSDASRRISYFFVESESSPATDKFVAWFNGGPGCSSQIGLWLEQGPLIIGSDGALSENAGRWNARANVLYSRLRASAGRTSRAPRRRSRRRTTARPPTRSARCATSSPPSPHSAAATCG